MKGIEAFDEVPLGNKTNKSYIVKRPSETKSPISLHDDKGKWVMNWNKNISNFSWRFLNPND